MSRWILGVALSSALLSETVERLRAVYRMLAARAFTSVRVRVARDAMINSSIVPGDVVAAVISNSVHSIVLCLAALSIGAIWSSSSPDLGPDAIGFRKYLRAVVGWLDIVIHLKGECVSAALNSYRVGGIVHRWLIA